MNTWQAEVRAWLWSAGALTLLTQESEGCRPVAPPTNKSCYLHYVCLLVLLLLLLQAVYTQLLPNGNFISLMGNAAEFPLCSSTSTPWLFWVLWDATAPLVPCPITLMTGRHPAPIQPSISDSAQTGRWYWTDRFAAARLTPVQRCVGMGRAVTQTWHTLSAQSLCMVP